MDDVFYKIITGNPEEVRRSLERFSVNVSTLIMTLLQSVNIKFVVTSTLDYLKKFEVFKLVRHQDFVN